MTMNGTEFCTVSVSWLEWTVMLYGMVVWYHGIPYYFHRILVMFLLFLFLLLEHLNTDDHRFVLHWHELCMGSGIRVILGWIELEDNLLVEVDHCFFIMMFQLSFIAQITYRTLHSNQLEIFLVQKSWFPLTVNWWIYLQITLLSIIQKWLTSWSLFFGKAIVTSFAATSNVLDFSDCSQPPTITTFPKIKTVVPTITCGTAKEKVLKWCCNQWAQVTLYRQRLRSKTRSHKIVTQTGTESRPVSVSISLATSSILPRLLMPMKEVLFGIHDQNTMKWSKSISI